MKPIALSDSHSYISDGEERPAKVPRRGSWSMNSELFQKAQQPFSLSSPRYSGRNPNLPDHLSITSLPHLPSTLADKIYQWIPLPSESNGLETMSQLASKCSRLCSSTDQGYTCLTSSENSEDSENSSAQDARSYIYKAVNYVTMLETKGCYMRRSLDGPMPEDIALCERLLSQPIKPPNGTLFDDEYIMQFHDILQNQSKSCLLVNLHPLIMPSVGVQYIQGNQSLKYVTDRYNDQWSKAQPIYGLRPQPHHARGLKWSAFTEAHRHKLSIISDEKLLDIPREDMFFPYLTAEIKCENQALEFADRQNMHNMCIAGRAVVSLCQAAGCLEMVHRRILGFSISHSLESFRIYGYYPEVGNGKVSFYRWPISQRSIWTLEDRWTCYQFVENVDLEFLPIHINRLMDLLEKVPDPDVFGVDLQLSIIGSQGHHISTQNHGLQPELQKMIEVLQQQLTEQKTREERLIAQLELQGRFIAQVEEQKERGEKREERLIAQLELQGRFIAQVEEQKERGEKREERLIAQLELQGRLIADLGLKDKST